MRSGLAQAGVARDLAALFFPLRVASSTRRNLFRSAAYLALRTLFLAAHRAVAAAARFGLFARHLAARNRQLSGFAFAHFCWGVMASGEYYKDSLAERVVYIGSDLLVQLFCARPFPSTCRRKNLHPQCANAHSSRHHYLGGHL